MTWKSAEGSVAWVRDEDGAVAMAEPWEQVAEMAEHDLLAALDAALEAADGPVAALLAAADLMRQAVVRGHGALAAALADILVPELERLRAAAELVAAARELGIEDEMREALG